VCLLTVHVGGGSSPLSCEVFLPPPLSQAFLLLLTGQCCCSCQPPCLFTVHMGSGSSLLSCGVFLPPPLSQAFQILVAGHVPRPRSRQSLYGPPGLCIYSPRKGSLPPIFSFRVPHPLSCVTLLFLLLITQFLFFPQVDVSLSRGLCCSGPGLSVGVPQYHEAHLVHVFPSHLGSSDWWPGGPPCFSI
jgi:hypothetical protein